MEGKKKKKTIDFFSYHSSALEREAAAASSSDARVLQLGRSFTSDDVVRVGENMHRLSSFLAASLSFPSDMNVGSKYYTTRVQQTISFR